MYPLMFLLNPIHSSTSNARQRKMYEQSLMSEYRHMSEQRQESKLTKMSKQRQNLNQLQILNNVKRRSMLNIPTTPNNYQCKKTLSFFNHLLMFTQCFNRVKCPDIAYQAS